MRVVAKIPIETIKLILKIIYKIAKYFSIFYEDNFADGTALDDSVNRCSAIICPECGSENITLSKFGNGNVTEYYHCYDCGRNWIK